MRKRFYLVILLISLLLLTGCGKETYEYDGKDLFYYLNNDMTDDINENGAKLVVDSGQAFIEITDKGKYKTYTKGEYKLEKKEDRYNYYFVNLDKVKGIKYGNSETMKISDDVYGELQLNLFGFYDYEIVDIKKFVSTYVSLDDSVVIKIEDYAEYVILEKILNEVKKIDFSNSQLSVFIDDIVNNTEKALGDYGINCSNFVIENISLTDDSKNKVDSIYIQNSLKKSVVDNSTWISNDGSELIFTESGFKWYKQEGIYDDNIQQGDFAFYCGELAMNFVTEDLKSFSNTKNNIDSLINNNDQYSESNLIAFNLSVKGYTMDGESATVNQSIYWYGFLVKDNTELQIFNVNTSSYYVFVKKK